MMSTSNKETEVFEYDDYKIPPYDPSIPPEDRERLKTEAEKRLKEIAAAAAAKYRKQ